MSEVDNEYIRVPNQLELQELVLNSNNFKLFVEKYGCNLKNNKICLNYLRDYYLYDRNATLDLIDEFYIRGFEFITLQPSALLPKINNNFNKDILNVEFNKNRFNDINFIMAGLGDVVKRFNVSSDLFFNKISIEAFLHLNKAIDLVILKNEFIKCGFSFYPQNDNNILINEIKLKTNNDRILDSGNNNLIFIQTAFYEGIFNNFNKYCMDNSLKTLEDLKTFDFECLINIRGFGLARIDKIKSRYYFLLEHHGNIPAEFYENSKNIDENYTFKSLDPKLDNVPIFAAFARNKFQKFLEFCKVNNLTYLGELEHFDFSLFLNFEGVNTTKINQIITRYNELMLYSTRNNNDLLIDIYNNSLHQELIIHDDFKNISLKFIFDAHIVKYFTTKNIELIGEIKHYDYQSLINVKNIGSAKSKKITDKIQLFQNDIKSYLAEELNILRSDDNFKIYMERVLFKKTLEVIGKEKGVTRERIRQQEKKAKNKVSELVVIFIEFLCQSGFLEKNDILDFDEIISYFGSAENAMLVKNCIETNAYSNIQYLEELDILLINKDKELVKSKLNIILEDLGSFFNFYEIIIDVEDSIKEAGLSFVSIFMFEEYIKYNKYNKYNDYYSKIKLTKKEICMFILENNFLEGIEDCAEHISLVIKYSIDEFGVDFFLNNSDRSIWALISNDAIEAVLWGKSKRVHINNVKISKNIILKLQNLINEAFVVTEMISVDYLFEQVSEELLSENSNVKDKRSLFGVLKYHFNDIYYCDNLRIGKLDTKTQTAPEILELYVLENDGCVQLQKARNELKWTEAMISNNLVYSKNLLYGNGGKIIIHSSTLNLTEDFEVEFLGKINESFVDGYTNSSMIFAKAKVLLMSNSVYDKVATFSLAKFLFQDKFYFTSRTHILLERIEVKINTEYLIYKLFEDKKVRTYKEIKNIMMNTYSFGETKVGISIDKASQNLFQLNMDSFCLVSTINITENDIRQVHDIILKALENKPYLLINEFDDTILNKNRTNIGDQSFRWNRYFVNSIVLHYFKNEYRLISKKNKDWRYDNNILVKVDSHFDNYIDLLIYIIKYEYNDNANMLIDKIEKYLVDRQLLYKKFPEEFFKSEKIITDGFGRLTIRGEL